MRQQSEPFTDEERAKWPYGEPQALPAGINNGALQDAADFVTGRIKKFGEPVDVVSAVAVAMANERLAATKNAVVVEIIDGKPVVSVMARDERQRPELEALARQIIRSGIGEAE